MLSGFFKITILNLSRIWPNVPISMNDAMIVTFCEILNNQLLIKYFRVSNQKLSKVKKKCLVTIYWKPISYIYLLCSDKDFFHNIT